MTSLIDSGEFRSVCHGDVELRFCAPVAYEVRRGWQEGLYTCVLRDGALAGRLRERHNHGRGATPAGAVKSLQRKLLRVVLSGACPSVLASLVEHVGPREHDSRAPVTELLKHALIAQWLCLEERRGRVYSEVCIRQDPAGPPLTTAPSYRLDMVLLEPPQGELPLRITAVEVKSSRSDFSADRKWRSYIGRADRLYIATLPGVVREGELPEGVGLYELSRDTDSLFFDRPVVATDSAVSNEARLDLLYGLATCDRVHAKGLDTVQTVRHAVTEYWESTQKKNKKMGSAVATSAVKTF